MIECADFYKSIDKAGIHFFCGVPDSLLKDLCAFIDENVPVGRHIIAANEGNAIAIATGYHLSTGEASLVYMQNSGLGNAVNPLVSLADKAVYGIPMLLLIGWRGEPGVHDEPQHRIQGRITRELLEVLGVPCEVLSDQSALANEQICRAVQTMKATRSPFALVVRKKTFAPHAAVVRNSSLPLNRERALGVIVDSVGNDGIVVSTTGKISRELFEYREREGQTHEKDFLMVGSMGHASSIALGLACGHPDIDVYCLDGDGAAIMHMGALAIIGSHAPNNFKHIIFNNGAHESVGGQPTVGFNMDLAGVAQSCGYKKVFRVDTEDGLRVSLQDAKGVSGPVLVEVRVSIGSRADLNRPSVPLAESRDTLMAFMRAR